MKIIFSTKYCDIRNQQPFFDYETYSYKVANPFGDSPPLRNILYKNHKIYLVARKLARGESGFALRIIAHCTLPFLALGKSIWSPRPPPSFFIERNYSSCSRYTPLETEFQEEYFSLDKGKSYCRCRTSHSLISSIHILGLFSHTYSMVPHTMSYCWTFFLSPGLCII